MCLEHVKMKRMGRHMFTPEKKAAIGVRKGYIRRLRLIELSEMQNHRCCYCGAQTWHMTIDDGGVGKRDKNNRATLEHVVAVSNGGSYCKDNLVMACHECNSARGHMSVAKFIGRITTEIKVPLSRKQNRAKKKRAKLEGDKGALKIAKTFRLILIASFTLPELFDEILNDETLHIKQMVKLNPPGLNTTFSRIRKRVIANNMILK